MSRTWSVLIIRGVLSQSTFRLIIKMVVLVVSAVLIVDYSDGVPIRRPPIIIQQTHSYAVYRVFGPVTTSSRMR